jgi:hypothetical protein
MASLSRKGAVFGDTRDWLARQAFEELIDSQHYSNKVFEEEKLFRPKKAVLYRTMYIRPIMLANQKYAWQSVDESLKSRQAGSCAGQNQRGHGLKYRIKHEL